MLMFVAIFGIGFVILLIGMVFGHDGDADAGGDFDHDAHGPSIFSVRMVALVLVGFGAAGFAVRASSGASMFASSMGGIGGALFMGVIGYFVIRAFYTSQASSTVLDRDVIGCQGNLLDAIPQNGRGQVACVVRGREITFMARSTDGRAVGRGAPVRIVAKTGGVVTVEPIE